MGGKFYRGGIDAGGTTFKCGVADEEGVLVQQCRVRVTSPTETISQCLEFFRPLYESERLRSFGIASFGPIDVDLSSPDYGTILSTPKPAWSHTNLRAAFEKTIGLPVAVDVDVNGALLAERTLGAAKGTKSAVYVTVGTGIGASIFANGSFLGRPVHPEFGHIPLRRNERDKSFDCLCPFHSDCLEGMISAKAVGARVGEPSLLTEDDPVWEIAADYLAQACRSLYLTARPERIILGGGLLLAPHLIGRIRHAFYDQMGGYLSMGWNATVDLITTPDLGDNAGLMGAILLGQVDRSQHFALLA